jgi:precorrin-6A/cobalt-precorrin-6A reductase
MTSARGIPRLLILGGTREAAALARALARQAASGHARIDVRTSLAGRLATRPDLPGRIRVGGFGGAAGLRDYLAAERIDAVVDATHPFAARISRHAAEACAAAAVPRLMLVRPPWAPVAGDAWHEVDDLDHAARVLQGAAQRVFLTTGSGSLPAFSGLERVWFLVRLFESPGQALPLRRCAAFVARPPYTLAGERALLARHRIDTLVTKNAGGSTEAKLAAARADGVAVVMVRRPPLPTGERVETVEAALAWLASVLAQAAALDNHDRSGHDRSIPWGPSERSAR